MHFYPSTVYSDGYVLSTGFSLDVEPNLSPLSRLENLGCRPEMASLGSTIARWGLMSAGYDRRGSWCIIILEPFFAVFFFEKFFCRDDERGDM